MHFDFEELDYCQTPLGALILRRRRIPALGDTDVFEVKLGDAFLMSSLFNAGEVALAELGLAELKDTSLDVVVGGLGLGYTASATLDHPQVHTVLVIDALAEVIGWHQRHLVPLGKKLTSDQRCRFIQGDFFMLAGKDGQGFDPQRPNRQFHAILLDIDHSPRHVLHPAHRTFYEPAGLDHLKTYLYPGGVFALWSNDPPDDDFLAVLRRMFVTAQAHIITFQNPLTDREVANTIYVAQAI